MMAPQELIEWSSEVCCIERWEYFQYHKPEPVGYGMEEKE